MGSAARIQERNGELYVGESRVLVHVIATLYNQGRTPEQIQQSFPTISRDDVLGTITYYVEHRDELDARFAEDERAYDEWWAAYRATNAAFHDAMEARIAVAREQRRAREWPLDEAAGT